MANRWNGTYQTITKVNVDADRLTATFANGDVATVPVSAVTPANLKKILWREARVESDGIYVAVPAEPENFEIPWDVLRRLTDQRFAREMVELASKQAKYIGARLRELRERRGLTQAKVASVAGIEPANLSRIENGYFDVSASTLWKVLAAMGYSPGDLATDANDVKGRRPLRLAASSLRKAAKGKR